MACVKSVLWPALFSNVVDVLLSGGSLGYWTACNNFKRDCTVPYCVKTHSRFSRDHHLGVSRLRLFPERGMAPCEADWRHNAHWKYFGLTASLRKCMMAVKLKLQTHRSHREYWRSQHCIILHHWTRYHHTVRNWPAILSEMYARCLKMARRTRYLQRRRAYARAMQ